MSRSKKVALIFGGYTALGFLLFFYKYLDFVAREKPIAFSHPLVEELTAAYTVALLFPAVLYFARRFRFTSGNWLRMGLLHFAAMCGFSFVHTSAIWGSRVLLFPLLGLGPYDYGVMRIRYFMEFPVQLIGYTFLVTAIYLVDNYRALRDRELELANARLRNLQLQLQPHFLFNALNTISSVMYEDPRAADVMLSRLSDLLRMTLKNPGAQEVRLSEELSYLDAYLKIMQARFEERLTIDLQVEAGTEDALVPQLILQPLVENSMRHGINPHSATVHVSVSAARSNGSLVLTVRDTGPGLSSPVKDGGVGLSNTRGRLLHLYGRGQRLSLENVTGGGLLVTVEMPFHA